MDSTLKGKNLLQGEPVISFKSKSVLRRENDHCNFASSKTELIQVKIYGYLSGKAIFIFIVASHVVGVIS